MGVDSTDRVNPTSLEERIELVGKLYKQSLKRSELRDELFAQVSKQTRNNPDRCVFNQLYKLLRQYLPFHMHSSMVSYFYRKFMFVPSCF